MDANKNPGFAGRGSQDHNGLQIAGGFYHGTTPPPTVPAPREPLLIARDLYAAAEHLADLAEVIASERIDIETLSAADRLLAGIGRLIVELRQRQEVQS